MFFVVLGMKLMSMVGKYFSRPQHTIMSQTAFSVQLLTILIFLSPLLQGRTVECRVHLHPQLLPTLGTYTYWQYYSVFPLELCYITKQSLIIYSYLNENKLVFDSSMVAPTFNPSTLETRAAIFLSLRTLVCIEFQANCSYTAKASKPH